MNPKKEWSYRKYKKYKNKIYKILIKRVNSTTKDLKNSLN